MAEKCVRCHKRPQSQPFYRDSPKKLFVPGWCHACVTEYENALFLVTRLTGPDREWAEAIIRERNEAEASSRKES